VSLPEKGSPEWDLYIAAIEIAMDPPVKMARPTTQVSQRKIEALRNALDALDIDWVTAKKTQDND
jgi:hypothetical protein